MDLLPVSQIIERGREGGERRDKWVTVLPQTFPFLQTGPDEALPQIKQKEDVRQGDLIRKVSCLPVHGTV